MVENKKKIVYNMYKYTMDVFYQFERILFMKRIVIIPNDTKDVGLSVTKSIVECLKGRAELFMEEKFSASGLSVTFKGDSIFEQADFVIVIGGDGTMLQVAEPCGKYRIPVMGINMGRVGFMTEVEINDMFDACERLLVGNYKVEKRMMMDIRVNKKGKGETLYSALNDAVISKTDAKMISVELYADDNKINEYISDGIIISTPTGSTGYSLSAGGPVAEPCMELFIASPICAHMLNSRPAVMPADKDIILKLSGSDATVTVDGVVAERIAEGDEVVISKSDYTVDIIKMSGCSFYDVLINKLS